MAPLRLFFFALLSAPLLHGAEPFAIYSAHSLKDAASKSEPSGPGPIVIPDLGGALRFEGMDYLVLPKTLRGRAAFSVSIWFRADVSGGTMTLLGSGKGYGLSVSHEKDDAGRLRWGQFTSAWQGPLMSDASLAPGVWHNAIVTCDGTTERMISTACFSSKWSRVQARLRRASPN